MASSRSTILSLALAALAAVVVAVLVTRPPEIASERSAVKATPAQASLWTASAPGRIEPRRGEIKLSAGSPGRIIEVLVALNDSVVTGETLVRLDDEEARARVVSADAEVQVRRRERDAEPTNNRLAQDRRLAEDTMAASERALAAARAELDRIARAKRAGTALVAEETVDAAQKAVTAALDKLEADRAALRRAQSAQGVPLPTRVEAGLTASRADLSLAEAALERTRVRSPTDGTVLQLQARTGELAAASPEQPLLVVGDLAQMRARAELEERDVSKVKAGQAAIVRSDAYPGRDFTGRIAVIARTLAPAKLAQRGPRRPTDQDSLEILVDLDAAPELLPGMRVDVFFKADAPAPATPAAPAPPVAPAGSGGTSAKGAPTK